MQQVVIEMFQKLNRYKKLSLKFNKPEKRRIVPNKQRFRYPMQYILSNTFDALITVIRTSRRDCKLTEVDTTGRKASTMTYFNTYYL